MAHSHVYRDVFVRVWHESFVWESCHVVDMRWWWLIHIWKTTRSYSSIYKEWLTHTYFLIGSSHVICVDDDSSINEKGLDHVWEITQLYMWKDSSICENDSFICVPWRIRTCVTRLNHMWKFITWYVTMMTHPYMKNDSSIFGKVLVRMWKV